jgi:hypothetical protein
MSLAVSRRAITFGVRFFLAFVGSVFGVAGPALALVMVDTSGGVNPNDCVSRDRINSAQRDSRFRGPLSWKCVRRELEVQYRYIMPDGVRNPPVLLGHVEHRLGCLIS